MSLQARISDSADFETIFTADSGLQRFWGPAARFPDPTLLIMHRCGGPLLSRISGLHPLDASCACPHPHLYNQNNASRHCSKSGGGAKSPLRVGGRRLPELEQQLGTDLRKQSRGGNGAPVRGRRDAGTPELETGNARRPCPSLGAYRKPRTARRAPSPALAPRPNIPREAGPARRTPHTPRSKPPEVSSTAPPHASASGLGLAASRPSSGLCRAAVERDV